MAFEYYNTHNKNRRTGFAKVYTNDSTGEELWTNDKCSKKGFKAGLHPLHTEKLCQMTISPVEYTTGKAKKKKIYLKLLDSEVKNVLRYKPLS